MARIAGWILSILIAALLIGPSGMGKLVEWEGKEAAFAKLGFTVDVMARIGYVEIAIAVLFLIPQTAFVGAILVTAYLGGATSAHVRIGEPFFFPIVIGVLVWVSLGLRNPLIFSLACPCCFPSRTACATPPVDPAA